MNFELKTSSALRNKFLHAVHPLLIGHQVFDVEVHAIAPVVTRISGNVDALGIGIIETQALAHGQPVLKAQHAEHARRGELA